VHGIEAALRSGIPVDSPLMPEVVGMSAVFAL